MDLSILAENLIKINNSFSWINAGGCGEFARLLGDKLSKKGIKFKFVLISDNKNMSVLASQRNFVNLKENSPEIFNDCIERYYNGYGISHIMIYFKGFFIDSTGVYSSLEATNRWGKYEGYQVSAILSKKTLIDWCNQDTWNSLFDRSQLPEIAKRIENLALN